MLPLRSPGVIVPHTPQTEKLIGAREFALLPRGAFFVNIARGQVVTSPPSSTPCAPAT